MGSCKMLYPIVVPGQVNELRHPVGPTEVVVLFSRVVNVMPM